MRFAMIENVRSEAKTGIKGICPGCLQPVIAKCGQHKIHHWAHLSKKECDSWWEPETEWHRTWKNNFPAEWQEVFLTNEQNNEKHVSDINTPHGFVIEFQHSHLDPQDRILREKFYQKMAWVIDGTRLKNDYKRFLKGKDDNFKQTTTQGIFLVRFPDECFPRLWIESSVPVFFDFLGLQLPNANNQKDQIIESLWCLFPGRADGSAVVAKLSREYFLNTTKINPQLFISASRDIVTNLGNNLRQNRLQVQTIETNRAFEQLSRAKFRGYRRRRV